MSSRWTNTWYPSALAEKLTRVDLSTAADPDDPFVQLVVDAAVGGSPAADLDGVGGV